MPVDDIILPIFDGRSFHPGGVGTGEIGFGHPKAASNLAAGQRKEILLFLRWITMFDEELHIADIGGLAVEYIVPDWASAELFTEVGILAEGETHPAVLLRQERRPQTAFLDALPHSMETWDELVETDGVVEEIFLERIYALLPNWMVPKPTVRKQVCMQLKPT